MGPIRRDILGAAALIGLAGVGGGLMGVPARDGSRGGFGTPMVMAGGFVLVGATGAGLFADDVVSAVTRRPGLGSVAGAGTFLLGVGAALGAYAGVKALTD